MRKYCKAYHLKDLRLFRDWSEEREEQEVALCDDDIVYLWDDFTVVKSPMMPDKGILFDTVTSEWQEFCKTILRFEVPEDLRYAHKMPAPPETLSENTTHHENSLSSH